MNNTVNNIKITVEYTTPETDKFDLLMAKYAEAKQASAETISYYKPLADMAEEAKLTAILEQIEPIKRYLTQLNAINSQIWSISVTGRRYTLAYPQEFKVEVLNHADRPDEIRVVWGDIPFTAETCRERKNYFNNAYYEDKNILGNWDKWGMYEKLESTCISLLNEEITKQKNKALAHVNRFKNIVE